MKESQQPMRLGLPECAAVLAEFGRQVVRVRRLAVPASFYAFNRRVVLYGIHLGVLRWIVAPVGRGVAGAVDAVEASVGACSWLIGLFFGPQVARFTALYCGDAIRDGLRRPTARLVLQVHNGVASVVPESKVEASAPLALQLWEVRAIIDSMCRRVCRHDRTAVVSLDAYRRAVKWSDDASAALVERVS